MQDICSLPSSTPHIITQTHTQDSHQTEDGVQDIGPLANMARSTSHGIIQAEIQDSDQTEDGEQAACHMARST